MLGITSGAAETEESGKLVISQANLQFKSTVYLLIAVDYSAVYSDIETAKEKVTVIVDGSELTADEEVMATENFPANCVGFKYTKLGAKNMGDELEIKAFADGEEHSSTVYSVLEYTLQAKNTYPDDTYLMDVVDKLLAFGAAAQTAFLSEGKEIADEYDYDLTKAHSLAKLVDSVNPKNGTSKVILEEGRAMPVQATDEAAKESGFYWYNDRIDFRGQSDKDSLTAELAYTDGRSETVFAVPANQAVFMDTYTGPVVYYYNLNGKSAFVKKDLSVVDNPVPAFSPANLGGKLTADPTALGDVTALKGAGTINPGYIMIRGGGNQNFTNAVAYQRVSEMLADGYNKFTVSFTMATSDNNTPKIPLSYVALRSGSNKLVISSATDAQKNGDGMLALFRGDTKGILRPGSDALGEASKVENISESIFTPSKDNVLNGTNDIAKPSDFFTVHVVVTLKGDGDHGTLDYYINDEYITSIIHHANDSFFNVEKMYMCVYSGGTNTTLRGYIKNVVVTAGDIVKDYN